MRWQEVIITFFIVSSVISVLWTRNTIYCLISIISLILSLACFLIYNGLELIGLMLSIIYLGAILVFFIFVIMLIDLRFENLQELYNDARAAEPWGLATPYFITLSIVFISMNFIFEKILFEEFGGLEVLSELTFLEDHQKFNTDLVIENIYLTSSHPAAVGFSLFSTSGAIVGVLSLLILFSLYISLYTVHQGDKEALQKNIS